MLRGFVVLQGDGKPTNMEASSQFLFVFTDAGRLCMWSLTGREAKPYGGAGRVLDLPPDLLLLSMRCNCDSSKVSSFPEAVKPFKITLHATDLMLAALRSEGSRFALTTISTSGLIRQFSVNTADGPVFVLL